MTFNRLLNNVEVDVSLLMNEYFPDFRFQRKVRLVNRAAEAHRDESGTIGISRYEYQDFNPLTKKGKTEIVCADHYYDYFEDNDSDEARVWYVNFADPSLFVAYATRLFAQDEIQTLEMPLLAASKLYLERENITDLKPYTKKCDEPTPFLFEAVPYWNKIDTNPVLGNGRHESIYGNSFACASEEAIERGVTVFNGKLNCNIMAIAAPFGCSCSRYTKRELEYVLKTLLCSFSAASEASEKRTVIHSGNWGCGAFGGNKELVYVAQLICADICGVNRLVMHRVDEAVFDTALKVYESIQHEMTFEGMTDFLDSKNYIWGRSNGT